MQLIRLFNCHFVNFLRLANSLSLFKRELKDITIKKKGTTI